MLFVMEVTKSVLCLDSGDLTLNLPTLCPVCIKEAAMNRNRVKSIFQRGPVNSDTLVRFVGLVKRATLAILSTNVQTVHQLALMLLF